jgi:hypothetical protein
LTDPLADLRQAKVVLECLSRLTAEGRLDDQQQNLARLVRARESPELQQAALECALHVKRANDLLVADTVNTLVSRETPLGLRVAAARAAGHLLTHYGAHDSSPFDPHRAYRTLEHLAMQQHPPALADALREALSIASRRATGGPPKTSDRPEVAE